MNLPKELQKEILKDQKVRLELTRNNILIFLAVYFADYIKYEIAPFHQEILGILQSNDIKNVVIEAFRGSGKTTFVTLAYTIWAILGIQQKKFILLLAHTEEQARQYLSNIKRQLETNEILRKDLGPFEEPNDEWRATSIVLPKYNARITVASVEKHVRGLMHGPYRPQVVICDDLEDLDTVRTAEERKKLYDWLIGTIIPMGDTGLTRLIIIGTNLHRDSLIAQYKSFIIDKKIEGAAVRSYPIIKENGNPQWPGKFKDKEAVDKLRLSMPSESAWQREYQLQIIAEDDQVIKEEWFKRYDVLPEFTSLENHRYTAISIDPAFSEKSSADYTAIVLAEIYGYGKDIKIYILPHPINERLSANELIKRIKNLITAFNKDGQPRILLEDVAAQKVLINMFENENFYVEGVNPHGSDKRARLALAGAFIQNGRVLFPKTGTESLETQLLGFGREKHDDLADALSMLVNKIMGDSKGGYTIPSFPYVPTPPKADLKDPEVLKKAEQKADQAAIDESNYERSLFNESMNYHKWKNRGHGP